MKNAISIKSLFAVTAAITLSAGCAPNKESGTTTEAVLYRVETLVPGGPMHGAKGMTFGPDGMLYVGSVLSQSIYRVDVATGDVESAVGPPDGEADDIAFAPDGTMAWTATPSGEIRALRTDGTVFVVASGVPLINPLGFTSDGRLFAAQIGFDRLHEFDFTGKNAPRLVAKGIGHLNSFEITADDALYGPLSGIGQLARIDVDTGAVSPIVEDLGMLSAVNLDSNGQIYAVDWSDGNLWRVDPDSGAAELVAKLEPSLDNLAIGPDDAIYVSQPARSAIISIDPASGVQRDVVPGSMSLPGGLAVTMNQGRETLVVADDYAYRWVDTENGSLSTTVKLGDFTYTGSAPDVALNDGVLVFTDVVRSRVFMVDRDSYKTVHKWKDIEAPYGVLLTDNGEPIVADFGSGQIIRLSTLDKKSREIGASELSGPVGIAWASPDALYVTEALAGRVQRINLNDDSKRIISDGLNQPEGLAILADGRLVVVEVGAQRVIAVDPETGAIEVLAADLPVGQFVPHTPAPVHVPSGITRGENGVLYVTSDRAHSIMRLVPDS